MHASATSSFGALVSSDGFTDVNGNKIINFCLETTNGASFMHSIKVDESQTGEYIAGFIERAVQENVPGGVANVVIYCSDAAGNCKRSGEIFCEKFSHITWVPCTAHQVFYYIIYLFFL
jgi:hypothetical protein